MNFDTRIKDRSSELVKANLHISIFRMKFFASEYVYKMRTAPENFLKTMGLAVTLPTTAPVKIKAAEPILHASSFLLKRLKVIWKSEYFCGNFCTTLSILITHGQSNLDLHD